MNDKEKIITYIDKLLEKYPKNYYLLTVAEFIDSLQEEPVGGDLEEAAKRYATEGDEETGGLYVVDEEVEAFKAGAKWQKENDSILPKVWNRENMDEFSYQTAYDLSNDWMKETPTWDDVEMACKLGAKWKEEQLEKNHLSHCDAMIKE